MSTDVVIRADGLGKRYLIGHHAASETSTLLQETMMRRLKSAARGARKMFAGSHAIPGQAIEEFWALKNVSFEVRRGDVVGIVGRNGAGKSTLLKILSRITEPTAGFARVQGRVATLLEVGTGFHPELTGRENIFLNGAILGLSQTDIKRNLEEIVAFAEVERFLDTPVKRYSSGMYVRLAFAVAAQLEPDILIVDEVLAVGDMEFQRKCLGKMHDVSERGRTVLFVSHNMAAVEHLCSRALLFGDGELQIDGSVREVLSRYLATDAEVLQYVPAPDPSRIAEVKRVVLCGADWEPVREITVADTPFLRIELLVRERRPDLLVSFSLHDSRQNAIFSSGPADDLVNAPTEPGHYVLSVSFPCPLLLPQRYFITVSVYSTRTNVFHNCVNALMFDVQPAESQVYSAFPNRIGTLQVLCHWQVVLQKPFAPTLLSDMQTVD